MAAGLLLPVVVQQPLNSSGVPMPACKLFSYLAGTTTPTPLYTSDALTTALPNPVVANAAGQFPAMYAAPGSLKLELQTSAGVVVWTQDGVQAGNLMPAQVGSLQYAGIVRTGTILTDLADWTPGGIADASLIFATAGVDISISGLVADPIQGNVDGRAIYLCATAGGGVGQDITLLHDSSASIAGNRFLCPGGANTVIPGFSGVRLIYDGGSVQRWRVIG